MRLWHADLITYLPSVKDFKGASNQLGGQHTEVRMILAILKKYGKVNHSTVKYANDYSLSHLHAYGLLVIEEMKRRKFNVSEIIENEYLRDDDALKLLNEYKEKKIQFFEEHNDEYMKECLENLKGKGINIRLDCDGYG
ncbi:MAG: hypothetical protein A2Y18_07450 [Clostridiales bacterium GWD2_32_19]|nr:MAG: hypothetical protein A2Y18_07450 [Clostridiales bacterium GWD2_32_19]